MVLLLEWGVFVPDIGLDFARSNWAPAANNAVWWLDIRSCFCHCFRKGCRTNTRGIDSQNETLGQSELSARPKWSSSG